MSLEGNGGLSGGVPHYLQSSAQAGLAAQQRGRANFIELCYGEVRRIYLPRTQMNKEGDHLSTLAITNNLTAKRIRPSSSSANVSAVKYLL